MWIPVAEASCWNLAHSPGSPAQIQPHNLGPISVSALAQSSSRENWTPYPPRCRCLWTSHSVEKLGMSLQARRRWVEENIDETLTFYGLPLSHHKHLKSTNLLERLNEELKRRTLVVRIFPNAASCLRLSRALAVEMHENWIEAMRYLNMDLLREQGKARGQVGAAA